MRSLSSLLIMVLLIAMGSQCFAQHMMHPRHAQQRVTVADPAEDNYDVQYLKFNISLNNSAATIGGDVTTKAKALIGGFSAYVFELDTLMIIDSVLLNGTRSTVTSAGDVRTAALAAPIASGTLFTAQVFYHGTAFPAALYEQVGLNNHADPATGVQVTFTFSECYHAREWWPCKQSLQDKIDSVDMWITVPDTLKAGSNGLLKNITTIDASHVRYEWHEKYPIDYYLISATVAPYFDSSHYMHFSGSSDSMLIQNYMYNDSATIVSSRANLDIMDTTINYLSSLFGRYPFWQEKFGHCMAPIGGGEEHQTMTTIQDFSDATIMAHELGHEWFGDNVTCGTWADIVMNEGFATYVQYLFADHFGGPAAGISQITYLQSDARASDTGSCYVTDTTSEARIFNDALTYARPACVLHMLRYVINDDSSFFSVFKAYQQSLGGGTGTITDFKNITESLLGTVVNGIDLDTFFNQWFYLQGYPEYATRWNQVDSDVYVQLTETTVEPSSVPFFALPVDIELHSSAGDTIIRILNTAPVQFFHFIWSKPMIYTKIDPGYWLLYRSLGYLHDETLGVPQPTEQAMKIFPNPSSNSWCVSAIPANSTLTLTDITGKELWQTCNYSQDKVAIPAAHLVPGIYLLHIANGATINTTYKLVKE